MLRIAEGAVYKYECKANILVERRSGAGDMCAEGYLIPSCIIFLFVNSFCFWYADIRKNARVMRADEENVKGGGCDA